MRHWSHKVNWKMIENANGTAASCEDITIFSCWRLPGNQSSVQAKNCSLPGLCLTAKSEEDSEGSLPLPRSLKLPIKPVL